MKAPIIEPSSKLRTDYALISKLARESGVPVFLTKNGTGDTVLMDIDTYSKRESELLNREARIAEAEQAIQSRLRSMAGDHGIPLEESRALAMAALEQGSLDTEKACVANE